MNQYNPNLDLLFWVLFTTKEAIDSYSRSINATSIKLVDLIIASTDKSVTVDKSEVDLKQILFYSCNVINC